MIKCPVCYWNESCWSLEGGSCGNFKERTHENTNEVTEKGLIDRLSAKYCFLSRYSRLPRKLRPIEGGEL